MIEIAYVPSRCASVVISSLSMPMSGLNTGSVDTEPMVAMFSSVCDATWPMTSPVTSAPACAVCAIASRNAQHQPPIDDHAQRGRHGEHHLLLNFAEGHHVQARELLIARQHRGELAHLFLRGARENRITMKVYRDDAAAALHQPDSTRQASRCRLRAARPLAR